MCRGPVASESLFETGCGSCACELASKACRGGNPRGSWGVLRGTAGNQQCLFPEVYSRETCTRRTQGQGIPSAAQCGKGSQAIGNLSESSLVWSRWRVVKTGQVWGRRGGRWGQLYQGGFGCFCCSTFIICQQMEFLLNAGPPGVYLGKSCWAWRWAVGRIWIGQASRQGIQVRATSEPLPREFGFGNSVLKTHQPPRICNWPPKESANLSGTQGCWWSTGQWPFAW